MKIIFLNLWNGNLLDKISTFILDNSQDTDIFCFQEADKSFIEKISVFLSSYERFFSEKEIEEKERFAQATFVKKNFSVVSHQSLFQGEFGMGLALYTEIAIRDKIVHLCNIHGVAHPGKLDNEGRFGQSRKIIDFMKEKNGLKIIGGDLNVLPETESVQSFLKAGYRELILSNNIKTTRNHLVWDRYPGNEIYYSDYVFVDSDIKIKKFHVLDVEISDHLPIILEIEN